MTAPHFLPTTRPVRLVCTFRLPGKSGVGVLDRLAVLVARVGDRVHADEDTAARAAGWDVTSTRWGGRTYRHPGFPRPTGEGATR